MKKLVYFFLLIGLLACSQQNASSTFKSAFNGKFLMGTALNLDQIWGRDTLGIQLTKKQFNSIVAENCMKSMYLQPEEGQFFFDDADRFVKFGEENGMAIIGHTLVWHNQAPAWFFIDEKGQDVSREVLLERMKNHITTVVSRYKGKIKGWDVVNEAIDGDGNFRPTKFHQIIGEDYIKYAFLFAQEADPEAELYYNDFSMADEDKRNGVIAMVKTLQWQGVKVDGIGMQGHLIMSGPSIDEFEKSIVAFSELGVKVMITELDLSVLPIPKPNIGADVTANFEYMQEMNPYAEGLPDSVLQVQQQRYVDFFRLFLKHTDKIDRVTFWGVADGDSWKNDWPVHGRTDYALLFDRSHQAKSAVADILKMAKKR
ncbi:MAG: endo-1,4-beta-xylanase [Bacteroidales bacterium]|nr:endo-1,4-beta-xylanase [Bacteroidales bacterium]MCL2132969.1 endo-1,4-beta-xylanase [Bacteroidales bacterium]